MSSITVILLKLSEELGKDFSIDSELKKKGTQRGLRKFLLKDEHGNKYLLEVPASSVEKFYFKRSIFYQNGFSKVEQGFAINYPVYCSFKGGGMFSLYEYFDFPCMQRGRLPVDLLNEYYKKNSNEIAITDSNVKSILNNFLNAWPNTIHPFIKRSSLFRSYKDMLESLDVIRVCLEHGDFTTNNILQCNEKVYLMDFEFSRDFQPIGFDIFDYSKSIGVDYPSYYESLHQIKYELINYINTRFDDGSTDIDVFFDLSDPAISKEWDLLYSEGANYNLSRTWCSTWLKNFKRPKDSAYIFTVWGGAELKLLLPLYRSNGTLLLIGSDPDLFDVFGLLCRDEKVVKVFLDYVVKLNLKLDFRFLNAEHYFTKLLIKYMYQNQFHYSSEVVDAKPRVELNSFKMRTKEKNDLKRCRNRAEQKYHSALNFEVDIEKTEIELDEMIAIHRSRWGGGPFEVIPKFDFFIKELAGSDLVRLSRLSIGGDVVAYHYGYCDSFGNLNSSIPVYNKGFDEISPGKVLLAELISYAQAEEIDVFDFGRGAEGYKYWFANQSDLLINFKGRFSKTRTFVFRRFLARLISKVAGIVNG